MTWVLSAVTILTMWLMGSKNVWGPRVSLFSQVLWCSYSIATKQYGLLPACTVLGIVAVRNIRKWNADERDYRAMKGEGE
jgi:4-hydroxybenzoate polyprenyltransferase